jgi:gamma-glutamyl:cysteine ligase YbdK (ATP-grasp superfamily)
VSDVATLGLFEGHGIEIEYMLVSSDTLDVLPASDRVLAAAAGEIVSEVERGRLAWSNELVLHVIELKTNGPTASLDGIAAVFADDVRHINALLAEHGGRLMPSAMHPWMQPERDTRLWPHEYNAIYQSFDRIFDCHGHGWSNLQSMHLNLPFRGDDELARLHSAIRLVLPLLPAIAASSPFVEGRATGLLDNRLEYYRNNCRRIPCVTGRVIPERIRSESDYRARILEPIAHAIALHDAERLLDAEWVNARGAIARFERHAVEIRVIDTQEHPAADVAIAALTSATVRALVEERWASFEDQLAHDEAALEALLTQAIRDGERARLDDRALLACFGWSAGDAALGDLWRHLCDALLPSESEHRPPLEVILDRGPLARRIVRSFEGGDELGTIYHRLCDCADDNRPFIS